MSRPSTGRPAPRPVAPGRRRRLHGLATHRRGGPRRPFRRGPHHPERRRPRHRRRHPLAGDQPAPPRDAGGHRHRAHGLRDADVRGRGGPGGARARRRARPSTCRSSRSRTSRRTSSPRSSASDGTHGSWTCRSAAWSTTSRRGISAASSDPGPSPGYGSTSSCRWSHSPGSCRGRIRAARPSRATTSAGMACDRNSGIDS